MEKVLFSVRKQSKEAAAAAKELKKWLSSRGIKSIDVSKDRDSLSISETRGVELGVVIGGDGTLLGFVRRLKKKDAFPILGVNLGTLGFLTEIDPKQMIPALERVLNNDYREECRDMLTVALFRNGKQTHVATVLNDAALTKDARTPMLHFDVTCGGEFFGAVGADGYLISTPTGSTAYGMSAGGPIVHPGVNGMVLNPICSHTLSARPVVIPIDVEVELRVTKAEGKAYFVCDGQVNWNIKEGDIVKIVKAKEGVRLISPRHIKWSQTLRSKLDMK